MRRRLAQVGAVLTVLLVLALPGPSAATAQRGAAVFTGYGFETCTAPSISALTAWAASPYQAVGIYLGGVNRACKDGNLSAAWVTTTLSLGWNLLPLYVGLQAPCVSQSGLAKISQNVTTAATQGSAAADDAVAKSTAFGLPAGSPLYADIEGYATNNVGVFQRCPGVRRRLGERAARAGNTLQASTAARRRRFATSPRSALRSPMRPGSRTGMASKACSATHTSPTRCGRTISACISTRAATTRRGAGSR